MKFESLYRRVFITEEEKSVVADPNDPDFDVEPAPVASKKQSGDVPPDDEIAPPSDQSYNADTLVDFISKINDAVAMLNDKDGESLQVVANELEYPGSPFENLSGRIDSLIISAAKSLSDLSVELNAAVIQAMKAKG
jgi:hypothetical protein